MSIALHDSGMKHTISILVENHAGVLSRITGLFSRRGFNIDSLAVGITDDPNVSRITIVVSGDDYTVEQVEKQLNKLIDVIKLMRLRAESMVSRELLLVKVGYDNKNRQILEDLAESEKIKICNVDDSTMIMEICDTFDRIEEICRKLSVHKVIELVRTGTIALEKNCALNL